MHDLICDRAAATLHLDALFGGLTGISALAYRLPHPDPSKSEQDWKEQSFAWPAERDKMLDEVARRVAHRWDIYFTPLLRTVRERKKRSGCSGSVIWADVDGPEAFHAAVGGPLKSVMLWVLESGTPGHYHVFLPLETDLPPYQIEVYNRRLDQLLGCGHKWSNESLLRLAGTFNFKHTPPQQVRWKSPPNGQANPLVQINAVLPPDPGVRVSGPAPAGSLQPEPLPDLLPPWLVELRDEQPDGDRSLQTFKLVCTARRAGLTHGQTLALAHQHVPSVEKYGPRLDIEVERAIGKWEAERAAETKADGGEVSQRTQPHGWEPADLQAILDGGCEIPAPALLRRSDNICLLYAGKLHAFNGEPESAKSWAALLAIKQEIESGNNAFYIDFEDRAETIVSRLLGLGLKAGSIVKHLVYISPADPLRDQARADLARALEARRPTVIVVDGVTEAMELHDLDALSNMDFAKFRRRLLQPLQESGATVVQIDHVTKDANTRGRYAIGGQHKLAAIDGVAFTFEIVKPFARGCEGVVKLRVAKDRGGHVRQHAPGRASIAELRMSADGRLTLVPPSGYTEEGKFRPTGYMEKVSEALECETEPLSQNAIEERVTGKAKYVRDAVKCLHEEGFIERDGKGRYSFVKPFAE